MGIKETFQVTEVQVILGRFFVRKGKSKKGIMFFNHIVRNGELLRSYK
ncbi:hypothetical protein PVOR_20754 [Paenibacillus vortex V453]|uniref:Uncharacterized protein n=1 Tax=Paenibacillus vortex V453 TaxID=715225 RepID=A0A2R9SR08_9BACL|nr:hypothetical protein PVOR_20754 [Paenibacillus vortex V453]